MTKHPPTLTKIKESSPRLLVDLAAVQENYIVLKNLFPSSIPAAVIKANAYGLTDRLVGKTLLEAGCNDFITATLLEGEALRQALGPMPNIYVFHGIEESDRDIYLENNLIPVLNSREDVEDWSAFGQKMHQKLPAILKINTGMNRLGLSADDLKALDYEHLHQHVDVKYIMTHLACGRDRKNPMNRQQFDLFTFLSSQYFQGIPRSIAASSIFTLSSEYALEMTRQGLNLYGAFSPEQLPENPLNFSIKLQARIIQTMTLKPGDVVGYNARYTAKGPQRIGTIGIGYADGLPLSLTGQKFCVRIGGFMAPIIGEVSMDLATIDLTSIPEEIAHRNTWVDLFYDNMSLYDMAKAAGSSMHEILTRLGMRCNRVFTTEVE